MHRSDFGSFMAAVTGHEPFPWQERLLDHVLEYGQWPTRIAAPTGTGKTSVIFVHVFAAALAAVGRAPRIPRRLAIVVNRRAIVDSHEQIARDLQDQLADNGSAEIVRAVQRALIAVGSNPSHGSGLLVTSLRGGVPSRGDWLLEPEACQIICATPDMFGSRLLFRGYGSSRNACPREAGMVALDTVMVLDEAHLNRQLLLTARRVATLAADTGALLGIPPLQVVETTATPDVGIGSEIAVVESDLEQNATLRERLTLPKPLEIRRSSRFPLQTKASAAYVNELADCVVELREEVRDAPRATIGCVVNQVATAISLTKVLRAQGLNAKCWVGRMRPLDLDELRAEHPGLFMVQGDDSIDVLVATQTVEVGVDVDFAGLVTELASGTAIAQRAGRLNRLGKRPTASIVVFAPEKVVKDAPPYTSGELSACLSWLEQLAESPDGLAPWQLQSTPPPAATLQRIALHRLEPGDMTLFAATSERLFAEPDLGIWLRDDLSEDDMCSLVIRGHLPADDIEAVALLQATPVDAQEMFPVRLGVLRKVLIKVLDAADSAAARLFLLDEMVEVHREVPNLYPGLVVVIDSGHAVVTEGVIDSDANAVEHVRTVWGPPRTNVIWPSSHLPAGLPWNSGEELLRSAATEPIEEIQAAFEKALGGRVQLRFGVAEATEQGDYRLPWLVVGLPFADDETFQVWTPSRTPVTLQSHLLAVASRGQALAERLGLRPELVEAVRLAGLYHDLGKSDSRFQQMLGTQAGQVELAKSRFRSQQAAMRARAASGLPTGWRHEQLSVVLAADLLGAESEETTDLVLRLVGTSHGRGRSSFQAPARELAAVPAAIDWFDNGEWEALMARTNKLYGPWGCAYLEALLRAADGQVSKEGS